ncbi:tetratricopeptide repeat protein [Qipengyuania seohaensis]|uniref:tetratricopeptide repeat protein n=1 Tax=Qipengyuania seohaensis TaxID=266951 RepID=UPI000C229F88|nr:tetratricopeptide repeat protein [Qipengyuania seohaensis]
MTWLPIILLALAAFIAAVILLRLPRTMWTLLGATLVFGLAGYAMQGSPGQDSSPKAAAGSETQSGELLVSARREFFGAGQLPSRWIMTGDGFARRGDYAQASGLYANAISENPSDTEAWLATGIALVEHAEGNLTPAAINAFERAAELQPENGGARYFLGLSWLRGGEPARTRELWVEALEAAPEDAEWRGDLQMRLERLDALLEMAAMPTDPIQ